MISVRSPFHPSIQPAQRLRYKHPYQCQYHEDKQANQLGNKCCAGGGNKEANGHRDRLHQLVVRKRTSPVRLVCVQFAAHCCQNAQPNGVANAPQKCDAQQWVPHLIFRLAKNEKVHTTQYMRDCPGHKERDFPVLVREPSHQARRNRVPNPERH